MIRHNQPLTPRRCFNYKYIQINLCSLKRSDKGPMARHQETYCGISEGRHLLELLKGLPNGDSAAMFSYLTLQLSRILEADFALIGAFCNEDKTRIKTVSLYSNGAHTNNIEFELANTPCQEVLSSGFLCLPSGFKDRFPMDHLAASMGVEGYIGISLHSASGEPLGPLSVVSRRPLKDPVLAETALRICAERAAAELERCRQSNSPQESEIRLSTIVNSIQAGIVLLDAETHRIVDANEMAIATLGFPRERLVGSVCHDFICPNAAGQCPITDHGQAMDNSERLLIRADGTHLPIIKTVARVNLGGRDHLLESFVDISRRKEAEQALKASEERYRILVEHQSDLVVKIDLEGRILFASPSFSMLFGIDEEDLLGRDLCPIINHKADLAVLHEALQRMTCHPRPCYQEFKSQTLDGPRWIGWLLKGVINDDGSITSIVGVGRDITDRKRAEDEVRQLAYYDTLTGLPNRSLLHDRLQHDLLLAQRDNRITALLFLDLDRFKTVNDALGHAVGDELLRLVARRLEANIRACDTVARLGGDEFVIVLSSLEHETQAAAVASKIIAELARPFLVGEQTLYSGASLGIALFPGDGRDMISLLKCADMAMYEAKENGRGTYVFFSRQMNSKNAQRMQLEAALRRGVDKLEFSLHYQPQVRLKDGRVTGWEALLRWQHGQLGSISPSQFIPLAEESGLIIPLGEWALRTACSQLKTWLETGHQSMRVSVNLSPRQFRQPDLVQVITRTLAETGLAPTNLELELTESVLIDNAAQGISVMQELKQLGVTLSIDDFGTGYSSLSRLKYCPIERLKIDHSFIHDITTNPDDAAIVEAMIAMAHRLQLSVVAEGVETQEQLELLRRWGCDEIQGYYYSAPLPAGECPAMLKPLTGENPAQLSPCRI